LEEPTSRVPEFVTVVEAIAARCLSFAPEPIVKAVAPVTAWASVVVPLLALIVPIPTNLPPVVKEPVPRSKLTVSFESPLTLPVMLPPVMFSVSVPDPNRI